MDLGSSETMSVLLPPLVADPSLNRSVADATALTSLNVRAASAFVCDVQSMGYGAWQADADIYPASVIKVAIMAEVFHQYETGALDPNDRVVVTANNQTTTDQPTPFATGYAATAEQLVELMITHSDNVATNQLIDVVVRERVTDFMRRCGLRTFLLGRKLSGSEPLIDDPEMTGRNRLPAEEIGLLLALIATDAIPGAARQREILERCIHNDKLVPGLRPGDRFMHKTGETSEVSHDAGILFTAQGKRYVVVLYCSVEPAADGADASHVGPLMTQWMCSLRAAL
jgi:beta-lactamase class A